MMRFSVSRLAQMSHFLVAAACFGLWTARLYAAAPPREHLSLDSNWRFHLGDQWPDAMHLDKAGTGTGAASERFASDVTWRTVNLPHDWAVELPFDRAADGSHGFKTLGPGFDKTSIAWYRREFQLPAEDRNRRIWLTFDGVFRDATVWVNGWLVRRHEGGYSPFREDITDVVQFGESNVIAVRVNATKFEGWFYEGAGIYRHVWLDKTEPLAIAPDGIFVYSTFPTSVPAEKAELHVEVSLLNSLTDTSTATVNGQIISPDGKSVTKFNAPIDVPVQSQATVKLKSEIVSPVLWTPESPSLYTLVTSVSVGNKVVDRQETPIGVRSIGFDPARGFLLNGKQYEIHGTCNHQDHAGVGSAIPDALQAFRVKKLKEFGCNAIRTAHNPPTPQLLDACDRLGMLVMDESRLLGSDSENLRKWTELINRDRNHACVAIWSIANEEFRVQDTPQAASIALSMQNCAKRLDPARPVTYAAPEGNVFRGINSVIEVRGWNYHYGPDMDAYHAEHPNQPNVGTEQASVVGTRGIYANDWAAGRVSSYDIVWPGWEATAESWWSYFADRPWLSGGFAWTGFDYRGEPTPCTWPCINSHFGILDTCGFPKDSFYYYQSWWTDHPVLHLTPHWNWPDRQGQEIRVEAQSNCKAVELFLNDASMGKQEMKPHSKLVWQVKYAAGRLTAKGFDSAGRVIAETLVQSTGAPAQLQLTPDRQAINADGEDVAVFTAAALDAQGRVVPLAQNKINFALVGPGRIIGVGNGDPTCHEPDTFVPSRRAIVVRDWQWHNKPSSDRTDPSKPKASSQPDDAAWTILKPGEWPVKEHETAVYRAHVTLTEDDLRSASIYACFGTIDDHGWIHVNDQLAGESHDVWTQPVFEIKKHLHVGDNVFLVDVKNDYGPGGMSPDVELMLVPQSEAAPWSRSLFNGLAQVIVQSIREPGEIKLTAASHGLAPVTSVVQMQPCTLRPAVP